MFQLPLFLLLKKSDLFGYKFKAKFAVITIIAANNDKASRDTQARGALVFYFSYLFALSRLI